GDAGRGLAFLPLPAVDRQHLVVALGLDPPDADDVNERARITTDGILREVELERPRPPPPSPPSPRPAPAPPLHPRTSPSTPRTTSLLTTAPAPPVVEDVTKQARITPDDISGQVELGRLGPCSDQAHAHGGAAAEPLKLDFSKDTVGGDPSSFVNVVGVWRVEA